MRTLTHYLGYLNLALYTLVAVVALTHWRRGRGRPALWAALTFGALALVVDVGQALPENPSNDFEFVAGRLLVAVLVVFPYLLYRFTAAFRPPPQRLERLVGLMTVVLLVWTFVLPVFPASGEPRPAWFIAYLIGFLVHWTLLTIVVAVRLWRAGRRQPAVTRRRMQLLSFAATMITIALFLAAAGPEEGSGLELAVTLLSTLSAVTFLIGLAPPEALRMIWRRPEQERLRDATAGLMGATSEEEVVDQVLPPMAGIVGAQALAIRDEGGNVLASYGASDEMLAHAGGDRASGPEGRGDLVTVELASGSLLIWRNPYSPFFGADELGLLRSLGSLTGLALDRARLFSQERAARVALERADEVKTNFVALAAHELRTPVATIDGIVQTIERHGRDLPVEKRGLLESTLREQSSHMRALVDQLLDLSRLDADAIPIEPEQFSVRERVERLVASAGGGQEAEVRIEVPEELQVDADPNAFDRIVSNLIVNACRYGSPPVTVRAEQRDRHFRLVVEDRGAGVPAEFVPDLFERFTRSGASRERAVGTGLGLAIARSYANAHHGDLIYERAEPHGARFHLVLPRPAPAGDAGERT